MSTKPFAQRMMETRLMIDGLKEINENLPAGIKPDTAANMEVRKSRIEQLNSEQESLKAEVRKKTEQLDQEIKELDKIYSDTKKRIKLDIDQNLWRKFGIEDKK